MVAGAATISNPSGSSTVVNQGTNRAIIDWNGFSIGLGQTTTFVLPSAGSAILNRVMGSDPSSLLGQLQSNGQVFLINPNGVVVGQGATISTAAFGASTLDVANPEFLAGGDLHFSGPSSAAVVNLGSINAKQGDIYLIAQQVTNAGSLSAPSGTVGMAAGTEVTLTQNGTEHVLVSGPATSAGSRGSGAAVLNSGTIQAAQAELAAAGGNLYALAINNTGVVRSTGVQTVGGHIYLTASEGGGSISSSGTLAAANGDGSGGAIAVTGGAISGTATLGGVIDASATSATGAGGQVTVTAANVNVPSGAAISANGGTNGGTILIGGDIHGGSVPTEDLSSTAIPTAQQTVVAQGAQISANGGSFGGSGSGGSVVVWSDQQTQFQGAISGQGGAQGGNGGFSEVSSHLLLDFTGIVNLLAPQGSAGTLLLDPYNVVISTGTTANPSAPIASNYSPTANSVINNGDLETALGLSNVTITTGSSGGSAGTITLNSGANISWGSSTSLTLIAASSITLNSNIEQTGGNSGGSITLTAGPGSGITIAAGKLVETFSAGANITLQADSILFGDGSASVESNGPQGIITLQPATSSYGLGFAGEPANYLALSVGTLIQYGANTLILSNGSTDTLYPLEAEAQLDPTANGAALALITNLTLLGRSAGITVSQPVSLNARGVLTLNTTGTGTETGSGTLTTTVTGGLQLLGSGGTYTLTGTNGIPTLAGSTGSVSLTDSAALTINTVGATNNLTANAGGITIVDTNSNGITLNATNGALSASSGGISLTADAMALSAPVTAPGQTVTLLPDTVSAGVDIGGTASGLQLSSASLNEIDATTLVIGNTSDTTNPVLVDTNAKLNATGSNSLANITNLSLIGGSGGITVDSAVTIPTGGYLSLNTTATASQNSSGVLTTSGTGGLVLSGSGSGTNFDLAGATNAVTKLAAGLGSGTGSVELTNGSGGLAIGTVNGTAGITGGKVMFSQTGTVTETSGITATSLLLLGTAGTYTLNGTTNAVGTLAANLGSGTGTVNLDDGATALSIGAVTPPTPPGGSATNGVTAGTLILKDTGNVTQAQAIAATNLDLLGSGGNFNFSNGTTTNAIGVLAGNTGTIKLASGNLSIGTVNGTVGVTAGTSGNSATGLLLNSTGTVTQTQAIDAFYLDLTGSGGNYTLNNSGNSIGSLAGSTGSVSLTNSAALTIATSLGTSGLSTATGGISLTSDAISLGAAVTATGQTVTLQPRTPGLGIEVGNSAADPGYLQLGTALLSEISGGTLVIGNTSDTTHPLVVDATGQLTSASTLGGVTNLTLIGGSGGINLNQSSPISLSSGAALTLNSTGTVTQASTSPITATSGTVSLLLLGSGGTFDLNGSTNAVSTLAGNVPGGTITLTNGSTNLAIGTVNSTVGVTAGTLSLADTGTVSQTSSGVVTATSLELLGSGATDSLNGATNAVSTLAGSVGSGTISLSNGSTSLSIGTVNSTVGVTAASLALSDTGTVSQSQAIAANLDLLGTGGTYALNDSGNDVPTLAGSTGAVSLTDGSALTVNAVNGTNDLTATGPVTLIADSIALTPTTGLILASGQTVTLQPLTAGTVVTVGGAASGFDLPAAQLNDVTANTLVIGSDGGVGSPSGAITVTAAISPSGVTNLGLLSGSTVGQSASSDTVDVSGLEASGSSVALAGGNAVGTLAVKATGSVSFNDTSSLTVGTVNSVYGVVSSGGTVLVNTANNLTLAAGSGAAVSGSGASTAVQLADAGTFTNNDGSGAVAVTSGGGRWLIWSANPASDALDGLSYGFKQYNATYGATTPADSVNDGVLYTLAPTVSEGLTGSVTKTYDTNTSATLTPSNYTSASGAVAGDTVVLTEPTGGTYDTPNQGTGKIVSVSGISITSAVNGSATVYGYQVTSTASNTVGTISAAPLTYTATSASQTYGTAIPTFSGTVTGFVGGDTQASATTGTLAFVTPATQFSNVGSYAINGSGLTADNGNYTFVQAAGNSTAFTINPATLTYVASAGSHTYGSSIPTLGGSVTGFLGSDTQTSATTGTLAFATPATQYSNVGTYAINGSGLSATNYTFVQAAGNSTAFTISPATLTYEASLVGQNYGTAIPALGGTVTGFLGSDTQTSATSGTLAFATAATQSSNVGSYAINGSGLTANGNYTLVQAPGNSTAFTINPANLTYTASPAVQTYGTAIPGMSGTVTGFVLGQTQATATTGTPAFATPATQYSNVGAYAINGSGLTADSGNYTFVQAAGNSTAFTINPATLTYVASAGSHTYGSSIPTLGGSVTGFLGSDTQTSATTGTLAFATPATQYSNVGSYAINGSGLSATNYTFVQAAGNSTAFTISPATLTYAASPFSQSFGTVIPGLSGTVTGFLGSDTQTSATTGTLAFATAATQSSNAGTYAINGSGLSATNYTFVQAAGNSTAFTINPATLTYTASPFSQTYGTVIPGLSGTVTGFVLGQTQATATTGTLAFATPATQYSNVGSYAINGSGLTANNGNYTFVEAPGNSTAFTINPATLTLVYNATPVSQSYGTPIPTLTGTVTGFLGGDTQSSATTGTLVFTTTAIQSSNVGSYPITGSGLSSTNYTFVQAGGNSAAFEITPATLTYAASLVSQTYGTAIPGTSGTVTGFVLGQTQATATTGTLAFAAAATQSSNIGSYAINGSGLTADNGNYTFVQAPGNSTAFTINPATLTYTASPFSQTYGTVIPGLSGTVTGFVLGQTQATATTGTLAFATPATQYSNVGAYAINGSGLTANNGNYTFVQAPGNNLAFTINPATLTLVYYATPVSQTYGTPIPTLTGTVTGFLGGDTQASATTGTLVFTTTAIQTSNVGSYPITGSGLSSTNYTFVQAAGNSAAFTITPATLTYAASPFSQSYGTAIPGTSGTVTGFVLGQTQATATTGTLAFATPATQYGNVGSYAIDGSGLTANNGDYTFVQATGNNTAFTITPATLTYDATPVSQTYGSTIPALTGTVTGFLGSDTQSSATTGTLAFATPATSSSNVGSYAINGSGLSATNYTFIQSAGNSTALTINPAPLTLAYNAAPVSQAYGTPIPTLTGTVTGFMGGDTQSSATTGTLVFTTTAIQSSNVGSYPITGSGLSSTNYTFVQAAGNSAAFTITPATLTYAASPFSQTYGTAVPGLSGTVTGFVLGQTQATATTGTLAFATPATQYSSVGSYAINGSGLSAANYNFVQAVGNGTAFSIVPATLTLAYNAAPVSQLYGTPIPALTGTVTGFLGGDTQSSATTGTLVFTTTATQGSNVGSYPITGSGLSSTNYTFVQAAGNSAAFTITPATLTYAASLVSQTYGTAIPGLLGSVTGFVLGQSQASATTGTMTFGTPATQSSNVGTYAINGSGLVAIDGNYKFTQAPANAGALTISPATLTFNATDDSLLAGASIAGLTGTITGFLLNDTLATATAGAATFTTTANTSSAPGSYPITGGGLTSKDYVFVQAPGNATALTLQVPVSEAENSSILDAATSTAFLGSEGGFSGFFFNFGDEWEGDFSALTAPSSPAGAYVDESIQVGRHVVTYRTEPGEAPEVDAVEAHSLGMASSFTTFGQ